MPSASATVCREADPASREDAPGSVWARPSSVPRLTSVPTTSIVARPPCGPTTVAVCSSAGAACLTPLRRSTRASVPFAEAFRARGRAAAASRARRRRARPAAVEPAMLSFATSTAKTSATAIATPMPGEQLLRGVRAQAAPVEIDERVRAHERPRDAAARCAARCGASCRGAAQSAPAPITRPARGREPARRGLAGRSRSKYSSWIRPSRIVRCRSAIAAASGSWVTSSTPAPCSRASEWSRPTTSRLRSLSRLPVGSSARTDAAPPRAHAPPRRAGARRRRARPGCARACRRGRRVRARGSHAACASRMPMPPSRSLRHAFSSAETRGIRWKLW